MVSLIGVVANFPSQCAPRFAGSDANGTAAAGRGELLCRDLRLCTGNSVANRAASLQRDVDNASACAPGSMEISMV